MPIILHPTSPALDQSVICPEPTTTDVVDTVAALLVPTLGASRCGLAVRCMARC